MLSIHCFFFHLAVFSFKNVFEWKLSLTRLLGEANFTCPLNELNDVVDSWHERCMPFNDRGPLKTEIEN